MRIAVLRETAPGEARVALVPDVVQRLAKAGHQISIQRGAGLALLPGGISATGPSGAGRSANLRFLSHEIGG